MPLPRVRFPLRQLIDRGLGSLGGVGADYLVRHQLESVLFFSHGLSPIQ